MTIVASVAITTPTAAANVKITMSYLMEAASKSAMSTTAVSVVTAILTPAVSAKTALNCLMEPALRSATSKTA